MMNAPGYKPQFADLIGKPFKFGGRGPERFDCYGLVAELYARSGNPIPELDSPHRIAAISALLDTEVQKWVPCEVGPGAVLVFDVSGFVSHIGFVVNDYQFVHAWRPCGGVTVEQIGVWKNKIKGAYRYVGSN